MLILIAIVCVSTIIGVLIYKKKIGSVVPGGIHMSEPSEKQNICENVGALIEGILKNFTDDDLSYKDSVKKQQ